MNFFLERFRFYLLIVLAAGLTLFCRSSKEITPRRILVVPQLTRIGDLVCATPALAALKARYPECHLAVVVTPKIAGIIRANPRVDELIILEDREYLDFFGVFRFFRKVREKRFDCGVNLAASTMGTLIAVFGAVPRRIKIVRSVRPFSERLTDWMNTDSVRYTAGEYIPGLYVRALAPLGIKPPAVYQKQVFITPEGEAQAEKFLQELTLKDGEFLVGMSVTAGSAVKEWGIEKFAELVKKLIETYRARIVIIGSSADRKKMEEVERLITHPNILENVGVSLKVVVTDAFDLVALPSLMKRFTLFISADTGPTHIADALGVPLIDIVGSVDPDEQTPRGAHARIIRPHGIPPTIFALRPAGDPALSRKAAESITVDEVFQAFNELFSSVRNTKNL